MSLNYPVIGKIVGTTLIILGCAMMPSLLVSAVLGETQTIAAFLAAIIPLLAAGWFLIYRIQPVSNVLKLRDGFLTVALCWIAASLAGAVPYLASGSVSSLADAIFESTSGFTTTGATIFNDVEILPRGLLLWRSFSQWLGGMGILVFAISLLPALGISGQIIARAETPGPTLEKMTPKMHDSAKMLYSIYIGLTLLQIVLLLFGGMSLFDSCIFTFGSVASGGLTNYNDGTAHFDSPYIELVISFFTVFACVNFSLYYTLGKGRVREFFKDTELRVFLILLFVSTLLISGDLLAAGTYGSAGETLRYGFFHATSFITTTGHVTSDLMVWPTFSKFLLLTLSFIGGCSSSTGGAIKVIRVIVLFKLIHRGIYRRLHPRAVVPVKIRGKNIPSDTVSNITAFVVLYFLVFLFGALILSLEPFDFLTAISASAATLGNIGSGFGAMGLGGNYAAFSHWAKLFMSLLMLVGRLELFTILLLFTPTFWNPDKQY
ncbi:TrkH family potassium uptake protein [Bacilliculturomica massiliensis]|uniref:TrkH family potassium uptake protein n=1 Tax=Bacilliculturomica massiliensis TaxID=1917867 RepID=UPI00102FD799|nr:TrkH family potassium uptake protein [Bacilliculturomica massiliensis]